MRSKPCTEDLVIDKQCAMRQVAFLKLMILFVAHQYLI